MSTFTCPIVSIKEVIHHPDPEVTALDIITFNEIAWKCVDKRGTRIPGQLVVYIPIDSNVNVSQPEFEFLKPRAKSNGLCRIRTIKLRGEISQGLIIDCPSGIIIQEPSLQDPSGEYKHPEIGDDASLTFGITKYEPPAEYVLSANAKGNFPSWCPKTDAERYQNFNRNIDPTLDQVWHASIKMDGTSLTVFYDAERVGDEIGVCSRNQELKPPVDSPEDNEKSAYGFKLNIYWEVTKKFKLDEKLTQFAKINNLTQAALQCEICGPGIQENKMGLREHIAYAFDIYVVQPETGRHGYVDHVDFLTFVEDMGIECVPTLWVDNAKMQLGNPPDFEFIKSLKYANGYPVEGVVFIPLTEQSSHKLGRLKFKYINPIFLLKEKDGKA